MNSRGRSSECDARCCLDGPSHFVDTCINSECDRFTHGRHSQMRTKTSDLHYSKVHILFTQHPLQRSRSVHGRVISNQQSLLWIFRLCTQHCQLQVGRMYCACVLCCKQEICLQHLLPLIANLYTLPNQSNCKVMCWQSPLNVVTNESVLVISDNLMLISCRLKNKCKFLTPSHTRFYIVAA